MGGKKGAKEKSRGYRIAQRDEHIQAGALGLPQDHMVPKHIARR